MRIEEIMWDDWNEEHIARHEVSPAEVEQVAFTRPLRAKRMRNGIYAVYGQTDAGRYLTVFLAPRPSNAYYPVTARNMNQNERKQYSF
ncbi:hypothetical protein [Streptosporangium subroseum]|uniref:hypothetical protein n=1 Tax=Streptosporangium subroseum TaxID=106412 RepID=UPI0030855E7B|nr:hypothetical protein OHB15_46845 [Streptosporangium subroseum]